MFNTLYIQYIYPFKCLISSEMVLETTSSTLIHSEINIKSVANEDGNHTSSPDHYNPSVREINIPKLPNGSCGFHLSRSKWDPYPWVLVV